MLIRIAVLLSALCLVTGCSTPISTPFSGNSTQVAKAQALKPDTPNFPKSQKFATDRENQVADWGFRDGYEAGTRGFPSNPSIGIDFYKLTSAAEQKIYTDAYNNGYAQGKGGQPPTPNPTPTGSISPERRAELQRRGSQDGSNDARSGFAANPGSGITALGLTDTTEIRIYTNAYNNGYQQPTTPPSSISPERRAELQRRGSQDGSNAAQSGFAANPGQGITSLGLTDTAEIRIYTNAYNNAYQKPTTPTRPPTISPGQLAQIRQKGYNDGYNDAQSNFPQDPNRGIILLGLTSNVEKQAYTNRYNSGYQAYIASQQTVPGPLW